MASRQLQCCLPAPAYAEACCCHCAAMHLGRAASRSIVGPRRACLSLCHRGSCGHKVQLLLPPPITPQPSTPTLAAPARYALAGVHSAKRCSCCCLMPAVRMASAPTCCSAGSL